MNQIYCPACRSDRILRLLLTPSPAPKDLLVCSRCGAVLVVTSIVGADVAVAFAGDADASAARDVERALIFRCALDVARARGARA